MPSNIPGVGTTMMSILQMWKPKQELYSNLPLSLAPKSGS